MLAVRIILPPLLAALLALVAAWITTGSRGRRRLGVAVALASMLPAWLLPSEYPLVRGIAALVAFLGPMRVADLSRGEWDRGRRLIHVLSAIDSRRLTRCPPRLDLRELGHGLAWSVAVWVASSTLAMSVHLQGRICWLVRWGSGAVLAYAAVAALYPFVSVAYRAIGFDTRPLHIAPILSRSVQELWGERWARPISEWLADTFFKPYVRKRRPLTGILTAFAASAAFHAYGVWVALGVVDGLAMTACMFGYFVLQGAVMKLERAVGVRRWVPWAGRAWTVSFMLALSPMFVEPMARVMGFPACACGLP